jgi:glycosyltransferase involved in cell wall biosynthesis
MHLVLICKNEERRIRRTLESALPLISSYTILDTGSTDFTEALALQTLGDLPGQWLPMRWTDSFADARNAAFNAARAFTRQAANPYFLCLDAGEQIGTGPLLPALRADAYRVNVVYGSCEFPSTRVFKARAPWVWKYRVHEICEGGESIANLPGAEVFSDLGDQSPDKYRRYARLSELDLVDFPDDPRVMFYAAQNWYGCGEWQNALDRYMNRVTMDGFYEETWYATMRCGMCWEQMGNMPAAVQCYAEAQTMNPARAEPARHLARMWGNVADAVKCPVSGLFVERDKYL